MSWEKLLRDLTKWENSRLEPPCEKEFTEEELQLIQQQKEGMLWDDKNFI